MEVLVLGHKGMLGHMVVKYLQDNNINVTTTDLRWPINKIEIKNIKGDYIINCIGAIPQKTNNFDINWHLPIWLDLHAPCKIIHPGTDCEIDNDNYGISKRIAGDYIREHSKQTKSIKTSIIGPELSQRSSLLEWFLSQENKVFCYTKAIWIGNPTLEWSKQCLKLIKNWDSVLYSKETIIYSDNISKYDLLHIIKKVFNKDINIHKKDLGKNKCLKGIIHTYPIEKQLKELKEYYYDN